MGQKPEVMPSACQASQNEVRPCKHPLKALQIFEKGVKSQKIPALGLRPRAAKNILYCCSARVVFFGTVLVTHIFFGGKVRPRVTIPSRCSSSRGSSSNALCLYCSTYSLSHFPLHLCPAVTHFHSAASIHPVLAFWFLHDVSMMAYATSAARCFSHGCLQMHCFPWHATAVHLGAAAWSLPHTLPQATVHHLLP